VAFVITRELVEQEIRAFLREHTRGAGEHPLEASLRDVVDSLRILELVAYLEKRFELRVAPLELGPHNFGTIRRVVDYVTTRRSG
jgi:acyl carrier protein